MKVGVIGAGTMGQGIAKAFAQTEGFTVALCDIKQEWADKGKDKIAAGYAKLVAKGKLDQAEVDRRMAWQRSRRATRSWLLRARSPRKRLTRSLQPSPRA